jgi:hypothetical protein
MTTQRRALTSDERFKLLSNARRRHVLYRLYRSDGPVDIDDLCRSVTRRELTRTPAPPGGLTSDGGTVRSDSELTWDETYSRVRASLVGTHLPRLAAAGLVEFDGHRAELAWSVRRDGLFDDARRRPWALIYGLAGLSMWFLIAVVAAGLGPFATLPWGAVAIASTTVAVGLAAGHFRATRRPRRPLDSFEALTDGR